MIGLRWFSYILSAALLAVLELRLFVFIAENKLWFNIRNWWINRKLQPHLKKLTKHYVRIIKKTPKPTEFIYEVEENGLQVNSNGKCLFTVKIGKYKKNKFYLKCEEEGGKEPINLDPNSAYELKDNAMIIIYTNIKVYVNKTGFFNG